MKGFAYGIIKQNFVHSIKREFKKMKGTKKEWKEKKNIRNEVNKKTATIWR